MTEYITEFFGSSSGGSYTERREPIVRCQDCTHYVSQSIHGSYCKKTIGGNGESNGFCSWGERRGE